MKCSRLIITAENYRWAFNAVIHLQVLPHQLLHVDVKQV